MQSRVHPISFTTSNASTLSSFVVVNPSAWSCMDVSFKATWDILKHAAQNLEATTDPQFSTVDSIRMVIDKDSILDVRTAIIPTKQDKAALPSPLLLDRRSPNPYLKLHFRIVPPFSRAINTAMKMTTDGGTGFVLLEGKGIVSFMVTTPSESHPELLYATKDVIVAGSIAALRTPAPSFWTSGDVCTLLECTERTNHILVLVQQHIRRSGNAQNMELCCIPYHIIGDAESGKFRFDFEPASRNTIVAISAADVIPEASSSELTDLTARARPFGRLRDGRLFFVDRIFLYSDGFSQYNFRQGSAGGIILIISDKVLIIIILLIFVLSNGNVIALKHSNVDLVQRGSVVQAFIEDQKALSLTPFRRDEAISGQVRYFLVQVVVSFQTNLHSTVGVHEINTCYVAVSRCEVYHGLLHVVRRGYTQILMLSDGVRRVCLAHACHHDHKPGCLSNPESAGTCVGSIFDGDHFHFWGTDQGYPPRMA